MEGLRENYLATIEEECEEHDIDPKLIDAMIHVESSWNPWAIRYEPKFDYLENVAKFARQKSGAFFDTETVMQKCSFGLMQVMGGTARWMGFVGPLPSLLDPEVSIHMGIRVFLRRAVKYPKLEDQVAAYNAGSIIKNLNGSYKNQAYVDKVMEVYRTL